MGAAARFNMAWHFQATMISDNFTDLAAPSGDLLNIFQN